MVKSTKKPTHKQPMMKDVATSILSVAGPVTTYRSFTRAFQRYETTTNTEYDQATKKLSENNIGKVVVVKVPRSAMETRVFVKENPEEVTMEQLKAVADDSSVSLEMYKDRFSSKPDSYAITKALKRKLTEDNHVPADLFTGDLE